MRLRPYVLVVSTATLIAVLASAVPAVAQVAWTDPQLTGFADVVAHGEVISVEPRWDYDAGMIYTHVIIELRDVMKGDGQPGELLEIKQLGGEIDGLVLGIGGQASFAVGEETVFFLETRPRDGTFYTSALWQGKFTIERSTDNPDGMAVRSAMGSLEAPGGRSADVFASRMLRPWKEEIRAWASGGGRARGGERFDPLDTPANPTFDDWFDAVVDTGPEEDEDDDDDMDSGVGDFTNLDPSKPRWDGGTVNSTWQKQGEKLVPGKGHTEVAAAAAGWKNSKSSIAIVATKGSVSKKKGCASSTANDLKILVSFKDRCKEIANSGGTLAIGGGWWFLGSPFSSFRHGFVVTNSDNPALTTIFQAATCFQAIVLHEYGHAIGLGHSPKKKSIMFATISNACATKAPKLNGDDKKAIKKLYPKLSPEEPEVPLPNVVVNLMASNTFSPATVTVPAGGTVTFTNLGGNHNVTADDGSFRCANGCDGSGGNGDPATNRWSVTITFPTAGTVPYNCDVHVGIGMRGTVVVQ
jgi:plastocyanin